MWVEAAFMADESDYSGKLAWFMTGAVIGAVVALLYAPASGKETRELLSKTGNRGKKAIEETGRDIADAGRDVFERGRKLVDDAADLFERGRKLVRG
jgi:gas vesicle protein